MGNYQPVRETVVDKLVLAALALDRSGKGQFTAEDLVVKAWEIYPNTFGLAGYSDSRGRAMFPDSNRVFAEIMGSKPIRSRGFIEKTGSKLYALTGTGREYASSLGVHSEQRQAGLARDVRMHLMHLLDSRAARKFAADGIDAMSFSDAAQFIGVSPRSSAIEFEGRLSGVRATLTAALDRFQGASTLSIDNTKTVRRSDLDLLKELLDDVLEKFRDDWAVILKRRSER